MEVITLEYFQIGKIVNTQGLKGDVRVIPTTDDPTRFELLDEVEIFSRNISKILKIEKIWYHKQFVIIKFEGINNMTEAEKLKNMVIKIPSDKALPLNEDEYYIKDLYDMDVYTDCNEYLGKITDIITTGANDVYAVENDEKKTILIPAIKQCILNVNINENKMIVKLLEGLR